jgi:hypothetical protein
MQDWLKNVDRYAKAAERARDAGNWPAFVDLMSLAAGNLAVARNLARANEYLTPVNPTSSGAVPPARNPLTDKGQK